MLFSPTPLQQSIPAEDSALPVLQFTRSLQPWLRPLRKHSLYARTVALPPSRARTALPES